MREEKFIDDGVQYLLAEQGKLMKVIACAQRIAHFLQECETLDATNTFDLIDILHHLGCSGIKLRHADSEIEEDIADLQSDLLIWNALSYGIQTDAFQMVEVNTSTIDKREVILAKLHSQTARQPLEDVVSLQSSSVHMLKYVANSQHL